jgi:hypothetical protein
MVRDYWQGDIETGERNLKETWDQYWNSEDENLRRAYRNNLK